MNKRKIALYLFLCIVVLFFALWAVRLFSHTELDDVSPGIKCDSSLLKNSDVLWVIPDFNGSAISENKSWCEYILGLNKTLGLHGVYHTYREFAFLRNESYVYEGESMFRKCFGFSPKIFKAPQLALNSENENMLEREGYNVKGIFNQITHKVYHCNDGGRFPNWIIRIF